MRKKLLLGNWKMNGSIAGLREFMGAVLPKLNPDIDAGLALPSTLISELKQLKGGSDFIVSAQNVSQFDKGAYTGEISTGMLKEAGATHTLIGHSERRTLYFESDEMINAKVKHAISDGLNVVLCVGETLEEREAGKAKEIVESQLRKGLEGVDAGMLDKLVIAYEPVWAIGTGRSASAEDAEEMCLNSREVLRSLYGDKADKLRILYGGSVNPKNIAELFEKANIDGALVGGASLKQDDFISLIEQGSGV